MTDLLKIIDLFKKYESYTGSITFVSGTDGENKELIIEFTDGTPVVIQKFKTLDDETHKVILDSRAIAKISSEWKLADVEGKLKLFANAIINEKKRIAEMDADYHLLKVLTSN